MPAETKLPPLIETNVVPGTLYYWRSWRAPDAIPADLEIAEYVDDQGQIVWRVREKSGREIRPRALAVLVEGRQVRVREGSVREVLERPAPRIRFEVVESIAAEGGPAVSMRGAASEPRLVEVAITHVMERLRAGVEMVDATPVAG